MTVFSCSPSTALQAVPLPNWGRNFSPRVSS
jgi:hypothetical protein